MHKIFNEYIELTKKVVNEITEEQIKENNQKMNEEYEEAYKDFRKQFDIGICCYCNKPLKTFSVSADPCLHWLLRPKKVKKTNIRDVLKRYGYFDVDTYLRWVANTEKNTSIRNINDLIIDDNKLIETTIIYKHCEWSFSCAFSDLEGHSGKHKPHFHFQFRLNKQQFVNFSDYHVPFTDHDLWRLSMQNQSDIPYVYQQGYGIGMHDVMTEKMMNHTMLCENEEKAMFETGTLILANKEKVISGKDILDLMEKSRKTKIPMSRLAHKLDAKVTTFVETGKGVAKKASRTKARNKK
ncbi:MAG: hypothetical protein CSA47_01595 [Gammaproteobacteria bacterium]|nr:MAG: hypothetical protein CSA47_01595 [Gammaproteobacteria bacterium]